jgi:creatinine amidohydrolase
MAVHHMDFPGSMTLRPSTLIAVIQDNVLSLARHGFGKFLFVNGHGGNIATIQAAFYEIHAAVAGVTLAGPPGIGELSLSLVSWWELPFFSGLSKELFGSAEGSHATASEVALTQYAFPETIKRVTLDPPQAPSGGFGGPADFRRRYPDGRIGSNPGLATPEKGKLIFDAAVADLGKRFRRFAGVEAPVTP